MQPPPVVWFVLLPSIHKLRMCTEDSCVAPLPAASVKAKILVAFFTLIMLVYLPSPTTLTVALTSNEVPTIYVPAGMYMTPLTAAAALIAACNVAASSAVPVGPKSLMLKES